MHAGQLAAALVAAIASLAAVAGPLEAAGPPAPRLGLEAPAPPGPDDTDAQGSAALIGVVVYARGSQVVAELEGEVREGETLIVFDPGFRRVGKARVARRLAPATFLLEPLGSGAPEAGCRLAREPEGEAAARAIRENREESYRSFLAAFPRSAYRPRIGRELFRLAVGARYPSFPGTAVTGQVRLAEAVGRPLSLAQVPILLDRFLIAQTDAQGRFRIDGLPPLEEPAVVRVRVKDERLRMAEEVTVTVPGGQPGELAVVLPVTVTPTVLQGTVVDEQGAPLPGAEVWTWPYSMEVLTDEAGAYRISRRKRADGAAAAAEPDEPLFGDDYEVYAMGKGYGVGRVAVAAESFRPNAVPPLRLARQDPRREGIPELAVDLKRHLATAPGPRRVPAGATPMLNP